MENKTENKKFDIGKLQKNYFDASVSNVLEANKAISAAQNWLLVLGLAEMSFLGALLLRSDGQLLYVKVLLVVLLFSFILFILGSWRQYKHILSSARNYEKLSNRALEEMESGKQYVNEIPDEIKPERGQIKSNRIANILLFSSFILILLSTVAIIHLILYL